MLGELDFRSFSLCLSLLKGRERLELSLLIALRGAKKSQMLLLRILFEMVALVKVMVASVFSTYSEGHLPNEGR